jgi:hypothetical protein
MVFFMRGEINPIARSNVKIQYNPEFRDVFPQKSFSPEPPYILHEVYSLLKNTVQLSQAPHAHKESHIDRTHIPSHLAHQAQVLAVVKAYFPDDPTAQMGALIHDLGRPFSFGIEHIPIGYDIARSLGFGDEMASIALLHHGWGMGPTEEGLQTFNMLADREQENGKPDIKESVSLWQKRLGTQNSSIFLGGLATLVADQSKRKTIVDTVPFAEIWPFTRDLGNQLIQIQINKGSFQKGSEQWWIENAGIYFVLELIKYLEVVTNRPYGDVIRDARNIYRTDILPFIQDEWEKTYNLQG